LGQASSSSSFWGERANSTIAGSVGRRELEPSWPKELQESVPNTQGQLGNQEASGQELRGLKTPGL